MNADVIIKVGVQNRVRNYSEAWKPTTTSTEAFSLTTTLDSYLATVQTLANEVFGYVGSCRSGMGETTTHVSVTLDNVTHPPTATGVIRLPKGHIDFSLSDLEFANASDLSALLNTHIANLRQQARY